jgi:hypothetical protein
LIGGPQPKIPPLFTLNIFLPKGDSLMKRLITTSLVFSLCTLFASAARADLFTYTYTETRTGTDNGSITLTTAPLPAITSSTFVSASDITTYVTTGFAAGETDYGIEISDTNILVYGSGGSIRWTTSGSNYPLTNYGDFAVPGTTTWGCNPGVCDVASDTETYSLKIQDIPSAVPEPTSLILLLTTLLALAFVARKRFADGHK